MVGENGAGKSTFVKVLLRLYGPTSGQITIDDADLAGLDIQIAMARRSDAAGGITLLVTHRFGSVRSADLILVLASGRIIENGTHADLLVAGGTYAELFTLQASAYR